MRWITADVTQTLERVRPADVNGGPRGREVKLVSSEENGKSKTYETYRNLDIIQKRKKKRRQRNLVRES